MPMDRRVRFKRKGKNKQPNAKVKKAKLAVDLIDSVEINASQPTTVRSGDASPDKESETRKQKHLSGYIFMCNSITKPECYKYRVFGLPGARKDIVEQIKPGMKLFLFDFESKLLYGIYEATSVGRLNLEPAAFRGKYPAQVKFRISKECLPIPESSLKKVLKEHYEGVKFKQELSRKQVRKLSSSFRPLAASSQLAPQALTNTSVSQLLPPNPVTLYPHRDPYLSKIQYARAHSLSQTTPPVHISQPGYHRPSPYIEHAHPSLHPQNLPASNTYLVTESRHPYITEGVAGSMQEHYPRYGAIEERVHRDQPTSLVLQRDAPYQDRLIRYSSYTAPQSSYASSAMQPQFSEQESSQRNRLLTHYNYMAPPAAPRASAAMHPHVPDPQTSHATGPVSAYYSYSGASRIIR